ncbi:MAG: STAS domain-containing protein [Rhodomicrobium sp.]
MLALACDRLADSGEDAVLDLSKVEFADSSGPGALVFLHKRLVSKGLKLKIVGLNGQPPQLFTNLHLVLYSASKTRCASAASFHALSRARDDAEVFNRLWSYGEASAAIRINFWTRGAADVSYASRR